MLPCLASYFMGFEDQNSGPPPTEPLLQPLVWSLTLQELPKLLGESQGS